MQAKLSYDTLGELDQGAARLIIDKAIEAAVADLDDRGDDDKPRSVEIKLTFKKLENGHVETRVEAIWKAPSYKTAPTFGKVVGGGKSQALLFQTMAPEDPDQRTIDERMKPDRPDGYDTGDPTG